MADIYYYHHFLIHLWTNSLCNFVADIYCGSVL